jgi:glutamine synthetase
VVGRRQACRLEFKVPGADVNPYFSFAAILAAGLAGMDQGLEPPDPVPGMRARRMKPPGSPPT